jgi:hypothetical protein
MAEVIISDAPIRYTGAGIPDALLICSADGLEKVKGLLNAKPRGSVYLDSTLGEGGDASLLSRPYRETAGAKSALLAAIAHYLRREGELPLQAFEAAIRRHMGEKANFDAIMKDFEV